MVSLDSVLVHVRYNRISATGWQPRLQCFGLAEDDMRVVRIIMSGLICMLASLYASDADARRLRDEQHCLALALYWESRGEGRQGMLA